MNCVKKLGGYDSMGLFDSFKPKDEQLQKKINELETKLSKLQSEYDSKILDKETELNNVIATKQAELKKLNSQISLANDELGIQEVGFYKRQYKFSDSEQYKKKLVEIRSNEKMAVKNNTAGIIVTPMMLDNSAAKGKTMQKQLIKAAIRGFNGEVDALLTKISVSNVDKKIAALNQSAIQLNKMYSRNEIKISDEYIDLKRQELYLAAEFELEKENEKNLLREQREKEIEDRKLQTEIANKRKQLKKERTHYENILSDLHDKLVNATEGESENIKHQIDEYETQLNEINQAENDVDYREGHATAGYVYVISNIGSFGSDIYKIGVTRRLDPLERVNELGNASVPFQFDVHAIVFSEDAFGLESELHKAFEKNKVNKINGRKEYFHVPLQQIKDVINSHSDVSAEFTDIADAFEFRQSETIKIN